MSVDLVRVATVEECPPGNAITVKVANVDIALCNFEGEFFALNNRCPHRGGQLGDGKLVGSDLICPLHNWDFDVRTGISRYDNQDKVATYPAVVENGVVYLNAKDIPLEPRDYDDYLSPWLRPFDDREESMNYLHSLAKGKKSVLEPMRTAKQVPLFESLAFLPGGISQLPLLESEPVETRFFLGPRAKRPLELRIPVYVSHMSYGSLSPESKTAMALGAKQFGTAVCSGEGGMHPMEREAAGEYIFEMSTGYFGFTDEHVKLATAIDFKFGQAAKSGLGGILPAGKNTPEIAAVRGVEAGTEVHSPSRFPDLNNLDEIKRRVEHLRTLIDGPVGAKMAANRVEADLEAAMLCGFDFVTLDGRGGGTGAAPVHVKDNIGVPLVYAIPRARRWLDEDGHSDVSLVATGGLRTPADFAKVLALGADCVAISTAAMMAIGCQQYRACHNNTCPVGIATQQSALRQRFDVQISASRMLNFLETSEKQLVDFCRMMGYSSLTDLSRDDLVTTDMALAKYAGVYHAAEFRN